MAGRGRATIGRGRAKNGPASAVGQTKPSPAPGSRDTGVVAAMQSLTLLDAAGDGGCRPVGNLGNVGIGNGGGGGTAAGEPRPGRGAVRAGKALDTQVILRTRPTTCAKKQGKLGQSQKLLTNYFKLEKTDSWIIYQYRVDFSPDHDSMAAKKAWLRPHKDKLGDSFLFEGTMIFSSRVIVRPNEELALTSQNREGNPIKITVRFVGQIEMGNYANLQVYNILVRRCMGKLDLQLVGRDLYDAKASTPIPQFNLEVWPGYLTSIRQHEHDLLMCCELSHKVIRTDTAYDVLVKSREGARDWQRNFQQEVIGAVVMTPYNNKTYRVDDVCFDHSPSSVFPTREGDVSFGDYYKKKYNISIRDSRQPLLLSKLKDRDRRGGKKQDVLLVPELCCMTGITDPMRDNFQLMKALASVIQVNPRNRMEKLMKFNSRMNGNADVQRELTAWDLRLSKNFVEVDGRQIAPETIVVGRDQLIKGDVRGDWTRTTQDKPMHTVVPLRDWWVVTTDRLSQDAGNFVSKMIDVARKLNFPIEAPQVYTARRDGGADYANAVEEILARGREPPQLIFFSVPNNNGDRYSAIKKKCYLDRAINSQVVTLRVLKNKNLMTCATKVAIQINCKLGGAPWTLQFPKMNAMIVGFDVCHDSTNKAKSVGAVVATSNSSMTQWYSSVVAHTSGEELSDCIAMDIVKAVRRWTEVNGEPPKRIIVYRDGVGDGQISHVYHHEVGSVKKHLAAMGGDFNLAYIIVTKRINTRIFTSRQENPMPGTVVDDVITLPEKYDFYMISTGCHQGTVSPTSYNVIEDTLGWDSDRIQRLTFMLCHIYYNLSSTTRVPAPVQYAHKLAFLASQSLHAQPHVSMSDRLFFL